MAIPSGDESESDFSLSLNIKVRGRSSSLPWGVALRAALVGSPVFVWLLVKLIESVG